MLNVAPPRCFYVFVVCKRLCGVQVQGVRYKGAVLGVQRDFDVTGA
jgi:hypothetical protein